MKRCLDCHFLSKRHVDILGHEQVFSWTKSERDIGHVPGQYAVECQRGVWSVTDPATPELALILTQPSSRCYFFEAQTDMSFEAAADLQRRDEEYRELRRSHLYTRIALWVALAALLVDVAVRLSDFLRGA